MLKIFGITMRNGETYRLSVKATEAMNEAWLTIVNASERVPMTFEKAMENSCYLSNDKGNLVMEIEADMASNTYQVMYYFDEYVNLDVEISKEEKQQFVDFINKWKNRLPDNDKLLLGDAEWLHTIPDDIPWKKDVK